MKKFSVIKNVEIKDWIKQEFWIEANSKEEVEKMSEADFYANCSFGEVIDRDYYDEPTGYENIESIEEIA